MKKTINRIMASALVCLSLTSCLKNDIPYPRVEAIVNAVEAQYQCDADGTGTASATINKSKRTIELFVDDRATLSQVRLTKLTFTDTATLSMPNPAVCANYTSFPRKSFADAGKSDTRINCTKPVTLRLSTYQDYDWTLTVTQVIKRSIVMDGMIGEPVIDDTNHNVLVYIDESKSLNAVHVEEFNLGGQHGTVTPDPSATDTYDFSQTIALSVRGANDATDTEWHVYVYPKKPEEPKAIIYPMSSRATLVGTMVSGQKIEVEYKRAGTSAWLKVPDANITAAGTRFTALMTSLKAGTQYACRIIADSQTGDEESFTTAPAPQLTDASFDNWHTILADSRSQLYRPWAEGGESFWDTGNKGATTVGQSNTTPTDASCDGKGMAVSLLSKYIVIKFAAGSIFTGTYVNTDGTNGILSFGRPFNGFPTKLHINYKYHTTPIMKIGNTQLNHLANRPDSCHIYVALADWDQPREIRTNPSNPQYFDTQDAGILAYGELIVGHDVPNWTQHDIAIDYRPAALGRTPKYIVVVCTSSKYGDYFTGGEGSHLWIDNFELIYD